MSTTQITLVSAMVVLTITAITFGLVRYAHAHDRGGFCNHDRGHGSHFFGGHDSWKDKDMDAMKSSCKSMIHTRSESYLGKVEEELQISTTDNANWAALRTTLETESSTVDYLCDKIFNSETLAAAPAKLELMESVMLTGAEALQRIRPNFDAFYASLSQEQQEKLESLLQRHHRHHH